MDSLVHPVRRRTENVRPGTVVWPDAVAAPKNVRPGAGCRRRTENVRPGTVVWPDAVAAPKNVRPGTVANPIHKLNNNNMRRGSNVLQGGLILPLRRFCNNGDVSQSCLTQPCGRIRNPFSLQ